MWVWTLTSPWFYFFPTMAFFSPLFQKILWTFHCTPCFQLLHNFIHGLFGVSITPAFCKLIFSNKPLIPSQNSCVSSRNKLHHGHTLNLAITWLLNVIGWTKFHLVGAYHLKSMQNTLFVFVMLQYVKKSRWSTQSQMFSNCNQLFCSPCDSSHACRSSSLLH